MLAQSYAEFVTLLDEKGFLLFGGGRGLLKLGDVTDPLAWHNPERDNPWEWRNVLVEKRDGVYTRARGALAFLISNAWYPRFLAAYTPSESYEERRDAGELAEATWRMQALFERKPCWAKHEFAAALDRAFSKCAVERALAELQGDMFITISGETQRLSWDMKPVGWPSMAFTRVDAWADEDALAASLSLDPERARREIRARAGEISPDADGAWLDKFFGIR